MNRSLNSASFKNSLEYLDRHGQRQDKQCTIVSNIGFVRTGINRSNTRGNTGESYIIRKGHKRATRWGLVESGRVGLRWVEMG